MDALGDAHAFEEFVPTCKVGDESLGVGEMTADEVFGEFGLRAVVEVCGKVAIEIMLEDVSK